MAAGGPPQQQQANRTPTQSENAPQSVTSRKDRDAQLLNIAEEIKKYDIEVFKEDTLHKVLTIANGLTKSERVLSQDESKNLRYLDRISSMHKAL